MACPTKKIVMRSTRREFDPAVEKHLRECLPCRDVAREEEAVDAFFRAHFPRQAPSPAVWERIEAALAADTARVVAFPARRSRILAFQVAAAVVLVLLASVLCVSAVHRQTQEQNRCILASIDKHYQKAITAVPSLNENPFQTADASPAALDAAGSDNPFLAVNQGAPELDGDSGNPFASPLTSIDTRR